jgi:hypothetical protein
MPVRQKDVFQHRAVIHQCLLYTCRICRRVYYRSLSLADEQIAIGREGTGKQIINLHALLLSKIRLPYIITYLFCFVYGFFEKNLY